MMGEGRQERQGRIRRLLVRVLITVLGLFFFSVRFPIPIFADREDRETDVEIRAGGGSYQYLYHAPGCDDTDEMTPEKKTHLDAQIAATHWLDPNVGLGAELSLLAIGGDSDHGEYLSFRELSQPDDIPEPPFMGIGEFQRDSGFVVSLIPNIQYEEGWATGHFGLGGIFSREVWMPGFIAGLGLGPRFLHAKARLGVDAAFSRGLFFAGVESRFHRCCAITLGTPSGDLKGAAGEFAYFRTERWNLVGGGRYHKRVEVGYRSQTAPLQPFNLRDFSAYVGTLIRFRPKQRDPEPNQGR